MTGPTRTVKHLADIARSEAINTMGEAAFARSCLQFEDSIELDDPSIINIPTVEGEDVPQETPFLIRQVNGLMKMLAQDNRDEQFWQFAMVWLDGHGYGDWSVVQLHARLKKLKK